MIEYRLAKLWVREEPMVWRIAIEKRDIDETRKSVRLDLLSLPYSAVDSVYVNEKKIDLDDLKIEKGFIKFGKPIKQSDDIKVYLSAEPRRINIERYATIIVALIGLLGTILSLIFQPDWFDGARPRAVADLILFEADQYGVDRSKKQFRSIVRWDNLTDKSSVHDESITRLANAWAFVRIRDNLVDIRETQIENVIGPMEIKNGMPVEIPLSDDLLQRYENENKWLQLVVIAVPKSQKVNNGDKIRELGESAKVLISPAVKPQP
jgi:hypothetical protein